ncbi:hypothetical protein V2A60_002378 [Cordyceps javanica]
MTFAPEPLTGNESIRWEEARDFANPGTIKGNGGWIYWKAASMTLLTGGEGPPVALTEGKSKLGNDERLYVFDGKVYQET